MSTPIRVMEMLAKLHERGYELLRLSSGISPSGLHWRYGIVPISHFEQNGFLIRTDHYPGAASGSTGGDDSPFNWPDADGMDVNELSDALVERFPTITSEGLGNDAAYVAWFRSALEACRPDGALIMYGEYVDAAREGIDTNTDTPALPLPPSLPPANE